MKLHKLGQYQHFIFLYILIPIRLEISITYTSFVGIRIHYNCINSKIYASEPNMPKICILIDFHKLHEICKLGKIHKLHKNINDIIT